MFFLVKFRIVLDSVALWIFLQLRPHKVSDCTINLKSLPLYLFGKSLMEQTKLVVRCYILHGECSSSEGQHKNIFLCIMLPVYTCIVFQAIKFMKMSEACQVKKSSVLYHDKLVHRGILLYVMNIVSFDSVYG